MEFISSTLDQLNWWAIVVAVLATMPVGLVWYDLKMGFGKPWAKANKLTKKDIEDTTNMFSTFGLMIIATFATAVVMACMMRALGIEGFQQSLAFGAIVGLVLRGGAHFVHNGFTKKPFGLTLIDTMHDVVSLSVVAVILGLWQ